jgi:hypothetical protein
MTIHSEIIFISQIIFIQSSNFFKSWVMSGFISVGLKEISFSNGNSQARYISNQSLPITIFDSNIISVGSHYAEFTILKTSNPCNIMVGICDKAELKTQGFLSDITYGWGFIGNFEHF